MLTLLALLAGLSLAQGLSLPEAIKACKNDNTLDECAVKNGNEAWPKFINGNPKYRVPVLDPLDIKELIINSRSSQSIELNLTLTDVKLGGLKNMKIVKSLIDLKKNHVEWTVTVPDLSLAGQYKVAGKFLVLPMTGNGPALIRLKDMKCVVSFDFTLEKIKGEEYIKLGETKLSYETSRLYAKFDNLFNGDKTLSDNMNTVIDDNWEEFNKEMGPPVAQGLAAVFKQIFTNIVGLVPFKGVFL